MKLILRRMAMALLVSFGIVALLVPFEFSGTQGVGHRAVVHLDFLGYADDPDSPISDLATAPRISEADMATFPMVQKTIANLIPPSPPEPEATLTSDGIRRKSLNKAMRAVRIPFFVRVDQKVADAFAKKFFGESQSEFAFVYRGHLLRVHYDSAELMKTLSTTKRGEDSEKSFGPVTLRCETPVKVFPADMGTPLTADALAKWPALQEALEKPFAGGNRRNGGKRPVPLSD